MPSGQNLGRVGIWMIMASDWFLLRETDTREEKVSCGKDGGLLGTVTKKAEE